MPQLVSTGYSIGKVMAVSILINNINRLGGIEVHTKYLVELLQRVGLESTAVEVCPEDFYTPLAHSAGMLSGAVSFGSRCIAGFRRTVNSIIGVYRLRRSLSNTTLILTSCNLLMPCVLMARGSTIIYIEHSISCTYSKLSRRLRDTFIRRISLVIVFTDAERLILEKIALRTPVRKLPFRGFDKISFPKSKWSNTRAVNLVFAGRLSPEKNIYYLVELLSSLVADRGARVPHLHIFGEGICRTGLNDLISHLHLGEYVTFHGRVDSYQEIFRHADFNLVLSHIESYGQTIVEASLYGVPTIAFDDLQGPRQLIKSGLSGYLVKRGNDDLYEIGKIIKNLEIDRIKMRRNLFLQASLYHNIFVDRMWRETIAQFN